MKTLQLDGKKARRLYPSATDEMKQIFEDSFGKDYLVDFWKLLTTLQDCCDEIGYDPANFSMAGLTPDEVSYRKFKTITAAINGDWVPDFKNPDQAKWFLWIDLSGSAPSLSVVGLGCRRSSVGSRLCFGSQEKALHAWEHFSNEILPFLT